MESEAINQPGEGGGFAERVRSAVYWRWGSQVAAQLITWTATIMVVRLLSPEDYGLFAMTQAVIIALNFLNAYSYATSLIQAPEVNQRQIGQVFGMLLISNALLAATQFLTAPLAAAYYGQPLVADMLRLQAVIFLTTPFIALPSSLLARGLNFRSQALVNLTCAAVSALVALVLAWQGYGVWALVWAPIALFAVRGIGLTVAAGGLVKPVFDFRGSGQIFRFGTALTLCQLFWIVQSQSDIVIAGRSFTAHDLGIYSESLMLALILSGRFLPPLNEVAFPAYAELHNAGKPIAPAFIASTRLTMLIAAPAYVGLSLVAGPLVETFFGPKWLEMIPILAGLAYVMPAICLHIICSPATNAIGQPGIYVRTSIAGAIIMPVCFYFGASGGPAGLMQAWHLAVPCLLAITLLQTLPAIGVRLGDLARALLPAAAGCAVMALLLYGLEQVVTGGPPLFRLALYSLSGGLIYAATLWLIWPDVVRESWGMLRKSKA